MNQTVKNSGLATAGMVLGIIGVVLAWIPIISFTAFILGALALIFGIVGIAQTGEGKKTGRGKAIAAVVLAVVAIGAAILSMAVLNKAVDEVDKAVNEASQNIDKAFGNKTEELLANDVHVDIGTFSAAADEYGFVTTVLPVGVTNKNDAAKSYSIQIEAVDAVGGRILDETVYANNLGAGQTQQLEAFKLVTSDKVEALKSATFKVSQVSQM